MTSLPPADHLAWEADVDGEHPHRALPHRLHAGAANDALRVESLDVPDDLLEGVLDGEVSTVEHVELGVRQVTQVGAGQPSGVKKMSFSRPEVRRLRPALAQERLPRG